MSEAEHRIAHHETPMDDTGTIVRQIEIADWLPKSAGFCDRSYRQSCAYSVELARLQGAQNIPVVVERDSQVLGMAHVRLKGLPGLPVGIAYVGGGPLTERNSWSPEVFRDCVQALTNQFVQKQHRSLRLTLPVRAPQTWSEMASVLDELGFARSDQAPTYRTFLLPISDDEQALRAGLDSKWRNNLRKAEKSGLTLHCGTDDETFGRFAEVYRQMRQVKDFDSNLTDEFYARVQSNAGPDEKMHVSLALAGDEVAAGFVWGTQGDTCVSILSATGPAGRDTRAGYFLRWHGLLAAKERGQRWYDLGGVDPDENPGVFAFKAGMGGQDVTCPGPFEMAPDALRGALLRGAEAAYRRLKGLKGAPKAGHRAD